MKKTQPSGAGIQTLDKLELHYTEKPQIRSTAIRTNEIHASGPATGWAHAMSLEGSTRRDAQRKRCPFYTIPSRWDTIRVTETGETATFIENGREKPIPYPLPNREIRPVIKTEHNRFLKKFHKEVAPLLKKHAGASVLVTKTDDEITLKIYRRSSQTKIIYHEILAEVSFGNTEAKPSTLEWLQQALPQFQN